MKRAGYIVKAPSARVRKRTASQGRHAVSTMLPKFGLYLPCKMARGQEEEEVW